MCRFELEAEVDLCSGSFVFPSTRSPIGRLVSCEESVADSLIWIALAANRSFRGLSLVPNYAREQRSKAHSKEI